MFQSHVHDFVQLISNLTGITEPIVCLTHFVLKIEETTKTYVPAEVQRSLR